MRFVYQSFAGRYSDNPRAVYERLLELGDEHEHVWLADPDHRGGFPAHVPVVPAAGAEAVAALERADVLVANTHTELEWTKAPGARYLQTWHGTPLKRIHHDALWAPEGRLARLDEDVARWDALLSPNRASTERLRGAFAFTGPVLETGYPRNDLLNAPDRDERRARVRAQLGVPEGATAVLYTPTWRDGDYFGGDGADIELALDVEAFRRRLGPDHVLVLRLHYFMTDRMRPLEGPGVVDASRHPDVGELYLAADAMVTDYSSTMFDFAITGKPLLFLAHDLEEYGESVRGFYFDLLPEAPGPVVRTSDALLEQLSDLDAVARQHAGAYAAFRERYCHLEDGRATDRVLDLLLDRA
jgi:CDP-glycerol glycerophosphotransferase